MNEWKTFVSTWYPTTAGMNEWHLLVLGTQLQLA